MKVEEIKSVVQNLKDVMGIIEADTHQNDRRRYLLCLLGNAWVNLDRHRREMEAAETQRRCKNCGVELKERQFCPTCSPTTAIDVERLEKRLAETPPLPDGVEDLEEISAHLDSHDSTNFDHSGRLDRIENRIAEIYKSLDCQHERILKNRRRLEEAAELPKVKTSGYVWGIGEQKRLIKRLCEIEDRLAAIEEQLGDDATAFGILDAEGKAIECRLTEIERKHNDLSRFYETHMVKCHTGSRR